jgi:saccharopine dehydrogenase-like NADP-dependent oxidoreductase
MLLARGQFKTPGVFPPEELGKDATLVKAVIDDLAERGVIARELAPTK